MTRIINHNISNYYHNAIKNFSDSSKFLSGGLAKSNNTKEYSWIADMLFKNTGNESLNPHSCYLSFVSDRDIMYQEYANVEKIYTEYEFFSNWTRSILSDLNFELDTKQYNKIGQKYSEFDLVEYINASNLVYKTTEEIDDLDGTIVNHKFYRAPVLYAFGYKLNLDDDGMVNFDQYVFSNPWAYLANLSEYSFIFNKNNSGTYDDFPLDNQSILSSHTGDKICLFDYKLNVANPIYKYFQNSRRMVMYYKDSNHYQSDLYYPYYGLVEIYKLDTSSTFDWCKPEISEAYETIKFFPDVIVNGKFEPAKLNIYRGETSTGFITFNSGVHSNDSKDQSLLIYNISSYMLDDDYYVEMPLDNETDEKISGIDVNTEKNRRYSAVVTTEPYMAVAPIANGEVVDYSFIKPDGSGVDDFSYENRTHMFLRITGSSKFFTCLDEELKKNELNTDIINVISIEDILSETLLDNLLTNEDITYDNFGPSEHEFYSRQDYCLDDLVTRVSTDERYYREYYITAFGNDASKYSNSRMRVCGLGFENTGTSDNSKVKLNVYCTNYVPTAAPAAGSTTSVANEELELISDIDEIFTEYKGPEIFKPMIKLSGMNGYIKIMRKNTSFDIIRTSDGKYQIVYDIEFPYCPGSCQVRENMNFTHNPGDSPDSAYSGFVYKKKSYINAGSQEVSSSQPTRFDAGNDRYVPYSDDSFSIIKILCQDGQDGTVTESDPYSLGGSSYPASMLSTEKNNIVYPGNIVWTQLPFYNYVRQLTILKPRVDNFKKYATYELRFHDDFFSLMGDIKLLSLVDNRQWKFNQDQYVSYIGRENPSYVFEINISTLFENYTKFQNQHGAIPDVKRWLYGYLSGFSYTMLSQDISDSETEKVNTIVSNNDLTTKDSESDMIVEIWDQECDIGNSQKGNWRPFTYISSDYDKPPGDLLVENIYISDIDSSVEDNIENEFDDIYSVYLCYLNETDEGALNINFPEYVDYGGEDLLDGKSNIVLYDTESKTSLHVAYIKRYQLYSESEPQQAYKAYVRKPDDYSFKTLDTSDISFDDNPPYELRLPLKTISKDVRFSRNTIRPINGIDLGFLTRYLDLKSDSNDPSDVERYISDEKIFFRVRIAKKREYPVSYTDQDNSELPYIGERVSEDTADEKVNFPWYDDGGSVELAFNWSKINTLETVRKFGLNYFKCASK